MSTHLAFCLWCGAETACCNDEHVLGLKDGCGDDTPIPLEFCSLDCFLETKVRLVQREQIARELHPDWKWT